MPYISVSSNSFDHLGCLKKALEECIRLAAVAGNIKMTVLLAEWWREVDDEIKRMEKEIKKQEDEANGNTCDGGYDPGSVSPSII